MFASLEVIEGFVELTVEFDISILQSNDFGLLRRGMLLLQGSYGSLARNTAPGLDLCNEEENMADGVAKEIENLAGTS